MGGIPAIVILCFAFLTLYVLVTHSAVELKEKDKDEKNHTNGGWTILGFQNLLNALSDSKQKGKYATVFQKSSGRRFMIELHEVKELPDGSIQKIDSKDA
jgi:hypothetical protein